MKLRCAATGLLFAACAVLTAAGIAGAKPTLSGEKSSTPPGLTVSVFDYTGMPAKDLERAEACAAGIYREAGIHLAWSNFKTDPHRLLPSHPFMMRIFRRSQLDDDHLARNVAGFTWTSMPVSTMILDIIEDVARKTQLKPSLILGCTIAHEIGHMLMPGRPHAENGIMRSCLDSTAWALAARGQLVFSDEESRWLRNRLRNLASTASTLEAPIESRR